MSVEQSQLTDWETERDIPRVGDRVRDRDHPDREMLVVGMSATPAEDWTCNNGKTVAEMNESYPEDDKVFFCVFPEYSIPDIGRLKRYPYPQSRLEIEESWH